MQLYEQRFQPTHRRYAVGQPAAVAQPVTPAPMFSTNDLVQLGTIGFGGGLMALGTYGVMQTQSPKRTSGILLQVGSIASIVAGLYVGLKGLQVRL